MPAKKINKVVEVKKVIELEDSSPVAVQDDMTPLAPEVGATEKIAEVQTPIVSAVEPISPVASAPENLQNSVNNPVVTAIPTQVTAPALNQSPTLGGLSNDLEVHEEGPDKKMTRWIVIIVVLILLIVAMIGAIFYYYTQFKSGPITNDVISPQPLVTTSPTPTGEVDQSTNGLESVDESDSVNAIEKDIQATELEGLDQELDDLEQSL